VLTEFWEGLGEKLADRWLSTTVPALVFWTVGLAAAIRPRGLGPSLHRFSDWLASSPALLQVAAVVGPLLLVAGSAVVVQRLTLPIIRLVEGYGWPAWLKPARRRLIARQVRHFHQAEERFQALADKQNEDSATSEDLEELGLLESRLRRVPTEPTPARPVRAMPTRLGNVLRASETLPADKYGLDVAICWPRLWLLLPDLARDELVKARAHLNSTVGVCCWAALVTAWTPWLYPALPLGLACAIGFYYLWVLDAASVYGDLVESTFDIYRLSLYTALRRPLPANPAAERACGQALSSYLWRGSDSETPTFENPVS
jgi:hypothetical protein